MKQRPYLQIFWHLMHRDFAIFMKHIKSSLFLTVFWPFKIVLIFGYIMPSMGFAQNYGSIILIASMATIGLFNMIQDASQLLVDFTGRRAIDFELTLPFPPRLLILQKALFYSFTYTAEGLLLFPVGKLLLGKSFSLENLSAWKFIAIFIVTNLFFGSTTLLLAGITNARSVRNSLWSELLMWLWDFGGYYFTWLAALAVYPWFAYSMLLNPITYTMEGLRGAVLGPVTSLNFYGCLSTLIALSIACILSAEYSLRKKLDYYAQ